MLAFLAGVISVGAFAPLEWWWLWLLSMGGLIYLWDRVSRIRAFGIGLCFGLGQFGIGVSWVYISIQTFGGMPPVLAGVCVMALVFVLSLFPALAGWLQGWVVRVDPICRLGLILPVIWIMTEWVRGRLFTGLPWLSAGYAFLDTPLAGLAPIGGVYLVGLMALVITGVVIGLIRAANTERLWLLGIPLLIFGSGWYLDGYRWTKPEGDRIRIAIIQNNVPLLEKWKPGNRERIIEEYLARSAEHRDRDLVVWPEGAIPDYMENLPPSFWAKLAEHPADIAFGTLHRPPPGPDYYNSIVAVSDHTRLYNKQHLVPFGEFFPMERLLHPILRHLTIPMADFSSWKLPQQPLPLAGNFAAASICYEDAFPQEWRNQVPDSGFLLNVSEDMWFGDSLAPHQRLQMARFRAREAERPMVRSSNNGLSSLIDWRGSMVVKAPQFESAVVTGDFQPRTGITPYIRYGDLVAGIVAALMILVGGMLGHRGRGFGRKTSKSNLPKRGRG